MTIFFVSRHPGAVEWIRRRQFGGIVCPSLNLNDVRPGDEVWGTLPMDVAAEVCRRGAVFRALVLPMKDQDRGRPLSADEMDAMGAALRTFHVTAVDD